MILTRLRDWATRFSRSSQPRHLADSSIQTTEYEGYAKYVKPTFYINSLYEIKQGDIDYIKIIKETKYQGKTEICSRHVVYLLDKPPLVPSYCPSSDWRSEWVPVELFRYSQVCGLAC